MKILKQTEEYRTDSEEEAIKVIEGYRQDAIDKGYVLGASGYTYKTKKAKGEIIDEAWVVKVTKILGGVWDDD